MQIEAGRYYRTRDGRKVGPVYERCNEWVCDGTIILDSDLEFHPMWNIETGVANFMSHGPESDMPEFDLIAEWKDEPGQTTTLSTSTIDAIAVDSLKFHYATEIEPLQKEAFRIVLRHYGVSV